MGMDQRSILIWIAELFGVCSFLFGIWLVFRRPDVAGVEVGYRGARLVTKTGGWFAVSLGVFVMLATPKLVATVTDSGSGAAGSRLSGGGPLAGDTGPTSPTPRPSTPTTTKPTTTPVPATRRIVVNQLGTSSGGTTIKVQEVDVSPDGVVLRCVRAATRSGVSVFLFDSFTATDDLGETFHEDIDASEWGNSVPDAFPTQGTIKLSGTPSRSARRLDIVFTAVAEGLGLEHELVIRGIPLR